MAYLISVFKLDEYYYSKPGIFGIFEKSLHEDLFFLLFATYMIRELKSTPIH